MVAMEPGKVLVRVVFSAALCASLVGQSLVPYADPNVGIAMRVPKWLRASPPKTGDRQVLAQFMGTAKSKHRELRGEVELSLWVVRIERTAAPTTGGKIPGKEEEPEDPQSIAEHQLEYLNGGTTLDEVLERRGMVSGLRENAEYFGKRPVQDALGRPWQVFEKMTTGSGTHVTTRAFLSTTDAELFGLVAFGDGATAFEREVDAVLRTLRRTVGETGAVDDPYAESTLRDLDRRRQVRAELVPGWRAVDTENYIVITNVRNDRVIEDVCVDLEVMRVAYAERFPPAAGADMTAVSAVRVCDGYDDFLGYAGADMDGLGGYWSPLEEELVIFNPEKKIPKMRPWLQGVDALDVLHHEAMHQYFHYSNRQLAPASWFNEGYGEVFAGCDVDRRKREIKKFRTNSFRMKLIREERKRAGAPDLATMMRATQSSFYGHGVMQNYANAWSFCYFLEQERQKPEGKRNEAWARLPQRYIEHLRAVTDGYRKKLPDNAPEDWIMGFTIDIQEEAIKLTLAEIDAEELEKAWLKAQTTLR